MQPSSFAIPFGNPHSKSAELDISLLASVHERRFSKVLRFSLRADSLRVLRAVLPIVRTPGISLFGKSVPSFTFVLRFEDVVDVLEHDRVFEVAGNRIKRSNGGANFLLGMPDDGCPMHRQIAPEDRGYRDYQKHLQELFRWNDLPRVAEIVERHARDVLDPRREQVDVIEELLTGGTIQVCREYYGMRISAAQERELKHCCFMISRWYFDPIEPSEFEKPALDASARLRKMIDASIEARPADGTVLARMLNAHFDRRTMHVIMSGMMLGFVPTNTMAGDHILNQLLEQPDVQRQARRAAEAGDDAALASCLFEAFRFDPLDREPLRVCTQEYTLAPGKWYRRKMRAGDQVMVLTRSALMDSAAFVAPHAFNPRRRRHNDLLFGYGLHRCIGAPIAETQLTHMFKVLLAHKRMRRAPHHARQALGPFATGLTLAIEAT